MMEGRLGSAVGEKNQHKSKYYNAILNRLDADLWCWLQLVPGIRGMTAEMNDIATGI